MKLAILLIILSFMLSIPQSSCISLLSAKGRPCDVDSDCWDNLPCISGICGGIAHHTDANEMPDKTVAADQHSSESTLTSDITVVPEQNISPTLCVPPCPVKETCCVAKGWITQCLPLVAPCEPNRHCVITQIAPFQYECARMCRVILECLIERTSCVFPVEGKPGICMPH
jgi:hypothetical protein